MCDKWMHPQSKRWVVVANAWEEHRLAIMSDIPHWYLWAIAIVPETSAEGAHKNVAVMCPAAEHAFNPYTFASDIQLEQQLD